MKTNDKYFPIEVDETDRVELIIRNINGEGVLFTEDGKMIGHQVAHCGHYYYDGRPPNRVRMFRATFIVNDMKSDIPNGSD